MSSSRKYKYSGKETKEGVKNLRLLAAFIVIVVVAVTAIFMFIEKPIIPPFLNLTNKTNETIQPPQNLSCDDRCWLDKGIEEKSAYACDQILAVALAQECYEKVSPYSLDACYKVSDLVKKDQCMKENAIASGSLEMCDKLSQQTARDSCRKTIDPCYGNATRSLCLAKAKSNVSYCDHDEDCAIQYAIAANDTAACAQFNITSKQQACLSLVINNNECKWLPAQSERDQCYAIYAFWTNQSSLCYSISANSIYAVECYQRFAIQNRKPSECLNTILNSRWDCLYNYSIGADDPTGCTMIDELAAFSKRACFVNYARYNRNPGACALMTEGGDRIGCYQSSIMYNVSIPIEPQNCDAVTSDSWRDKCYQVSAVTNNDVMICEYIGDPAYKPICLSKFGK